MRKVCLSFIGRIVVIAATFLLFELFGLMNFHQYITTKMGINLLIEKEIENIILVILLGNSLFNLIAKILRKIKAKNKE